MGLFDKLKDILFDEETVEIPIISEEDYESLKPKKTSKKVPKVEKVEKSDNLGVKIQKIEDTPTRSQKTEETKPKDEDTLFDMPRLKEEAEEEVRTSSFTFPVFDDDDLDTSQAKRSSTPANSQFSSRQPRRESYDGLSESKINRVEKRREERKSTTTINYKPTEEIVKKPFTLSPIISPVYGILNENYTKEDIVSKQEKSFTRSSFDKPDLDEVRKKAYGTLEDEIQNSLDNAFIDEEKPQPKKEKSIDSLSDDGISIDDLLIGNDDTRQNRVITEEIEKETRRVETFEETIPEKVVKKPKAKNEDTEDLFELIDSLYEGKDEN